MFSFQRNHDLMEVRDQLCRLVNQRAAQALPADLDRRNDSRCQYAIPVEVILWEDDAAVVSETMTAITRDISDTGVGVIMHHPLRVEQLVLGFWVPDSTHGDPSDGRPLFLLADVVRSDPLGGCFWQIRTHAVKILRLSAHEELEKLVPKLTELVPRPQEDPELLHTIRDRLMQ